MGAPEPDRKPMTDEEIAAATQKLVHVPVDVIRSMEAHLRITSAWGAYWWAVHDFLEELRK